MKPSLCCCGGAGGPGGHSGPPPTGPDQRGVVGGNFATAAEAAAQVNSFDYQGKGVAAGELAYIDASGAILYKVPFYWIQGFNSECGYYPSSVYIANAYQMARASGTTYCLSISRSDTLTMLGNCQSTVGASDTGYKWVDVPAFHTFDGVDVAQGVGLNCAGYSAHESAPCYGSLTDCEDDPP